jgi:hypothetical protein
VAAKGEKRSFAFLVSAVFFNRASFACFAYSLLLSMIPASGFPGDSQETMYSLTGGVLSEILEGMKLTKPEASAGVADMMTGALTGGVS